MPPVARSAICWSIVNVVRSAGQLTWLCLVPVPWGRDSGNEIAGIDRCRGAASGRPTSREACSSWAARSTFVGSVFTELGEELLVGHRHPVAQRGVRRLQGGLDLGGGRLEHPEASLDGLLDPLARHALLGELSGDLEGGLGQGREHLVDDLGAARDHGVLVVHLGHRRPEPEGAAAVAPQPVVERALEDDRQEARLVGAGHHAAERETDLVAVRGGQRPVHRLGLARWGGTRRAGAAPRDPPAADRPAPGSRWRR